MYRPRVVRQRVALGHLVDKLRAELDAVGLGHVLIHYKGSGIEFEVKPTSNQVGVDNPVDRG